MSSRWTDTEFVTFDTETTGFRSDDRIIELSFVRFRGGDILDTYTTRVNPGFAVPPESSELHGITTEDLRDEPRFEDVADMVWAWLADSCPLVGHNLSYDLRMLDRDIPLHTWPDRVGFCTFRYAQRVHPVLRLRTKGHKLLDLAEFFQIPVEVEKAHGAEYDAMLTGRIMQPLLQDRFVLETVMPLRTMVQGQRHGRW